MSKKKSKTLDELRLDMIRKVRAQNPPKLTVTSRGCGVLSLKWVRSKNG